MAKGRILVVDDEIYIVHILDFSLGMEGYEVVTALDGEQAIEKARAEKPDLIVLDIMNTVREIVMSHHEWWDGSGYPRGLRGEAIPIGARVLAVVDAFESLTRGRAHRASTTRESALEVLRRARGTQFDPGVVDALERILPAMHEADDDTRLPTEPVREGR